jgi:hypothetical protein
LEICVASGRQIPPGADWGCQGTTGDFWLSLLRGVHKTETRPPFPPF